MSETLLCRGGGFPAFWYSLGHVSIVYDTTKIIEGYSSGALAAIFIIFFDDNLERIIKVSLDSYDETKVGLYGLFGISLSDVIYTMPDNFLPVDAHIQAEGRLGIIITSLKLHGTIVRTWASRDDLIACVVASCFIPGVSDFSICDPIYKSFDGGFAMNLSDLCRGKRIIESTLETGNLEQLRPISKERAREIYIIGRYEATLFKKHQKHQKKSKSIWYFIIMIIIIITCCLYKIFV